MSTEDLAKSRFRNCQVFYALMQNGPPPIAGEEPSAALSNNVLESLCGLFKKRR